MNSDNLMLSQDDLKDLLSELLELGNQESATTETLVEEIKVRLIER
ncbi:hypothetical protein [Alteribacter keqinensis]|nr:hypothetical protein [Alteribacter keqinensis]